MKGNLEGTAKTFFRTPTEALPGAASNARKEIEVRKGRSDAARELHYLNYVSCVLIYQDDSLSTDEKLQRVRLLRVTLTQTPTSPDPTPPPAARLFGLDVACRTIEPSNDVQIILRKFGDQALASAPSARIGSTGRPVIVRPSVGGDDHLGPISPNTRVRVICTEEDGQFAIIKQEKGNLDGVVETRALEMR